MQILKILTLSLLPVISLASSTRGLDWKEGFTLSLCGKEFMVVAHQKDQVVINVKTQPNEPEFDINALIRAYESEGYVFTTAEISKSVGIDCGI